MSEYSGADILARRFQVCRRKGYDTIEVDLFLEEIAGYVDELRSGLDEAQTTEFTAMAMLKGARQAADEVLMGSAVAASSVHEELKQQRANAEDEARTIVSGAQEIATDIVDKARAEADLVVQQQERDVAVLDETIEQRRAELASMGDAVAHLVHTSIDQLRESATSVTASADRLQVDILAKMDVIDLAAAANTNADAV